MSLNIKNERTHALVRELAELTGMSQTSAVEDAVRRRLDELRAQQTVLGRRAAYSPEEILRRRREVDRILRELRAETTPEQRASLSTAQDELYDELGLPT